MAKKQSLMHKATLSSAERTERVKVRLAERSAKRTSSKKVTMSYGSPEALVGIAR